MMKNRNSTPGMKTVARYSSISKSVLARVTATPEGEARAAMPADSTAANTGRIPVRIKVLETHIPAHNPYDIGTEKTLEALRQSGVLTKSGRLGRLFR